MTIKPTPLQHDVRALDDSLAAIAHPVINSPERARLIFTTHIERETAALVRHFGEKQARADITVALTRAGLGDMIVQPPSRWRDFALGFFGGLAVFLLAFLASVALLGH